MWHPVAPIKLAGVHKVRYQIEKLGCEPIRIADIQINDRLYDELVSQAESDSVTKCVSLNTSQKVLKGYKS